MSQFDFKAIESNWKEKWFNDNIYRAEDFSDKPKKYILAEFPYPSGKGIHLGHAMRYTMPDIYSRYLRMNGNNVLFPMGWDAFGLPAENYAIKTGTHPADKTAELVIQYRDAIKSMGYGVDWEREINTTDPEYYKWTQWIFLKFFEADLAQLKEEDVWWCEKMGTVLAEEEVIKDEEGNLISERGEYPVERKKFKQWVLKMPKYADKLIAGLDEVDFPESIKAAQKNWIGRKDGINISYRVVGLEEDVVCFTTRPDTNYGATFVVLAPEHDFISRIVKGELEVDDSIRENVAEYVKRSAQRTNLERMQDTKSKTGAFTGFYVHNPLTDTEIPVYAADFVLAHFGTGAVVGVPGHDMRDFEFAKKFNLPIIRVVVADDGDTSEITTPEQVQESEGTMINSGFLDGMEIYDATQKMMDYMEEKGWGERVVTYSLKDWIFTRQRYWGEPIPLIHKEDGTIEAIVHTEEVDGSNDKLPLELPAVPDYSPTTDGSSPLALNEEWVNTKAKDGTPAKRETDTMPNWAGSCWYYMRYTDPKNKKVFADFDKLKYWLPVDKYFGGAEHTTMHLLYSRFWHKFLYDEGVVPTSEPYQWRMNGGIMLGEDGRKMSKSYGNVVEPAEKLKEYGADAVRMYIVFIGPYDGVFPHNNSSLKACHKLVADIYSLRDKVGTDVDAEEVAAVEKKLHRMVKSVTGMMENMKMNTVVSELMVFVKELKGMKEIPEDMWKTFIKVIAPVAVFTAEELWQETNGYDKWDSTNSVHVQDWPEYNEAMTVDDEIEIPVQVNGKMRGKVVVPADADETTVREAVKSDGKLADYIGGGEIKKFIYVPGKIVNVIA